MITVSSESECVRFCTWPFDIRNLDREIQEVLFSLKWSEECVDELDLIGEKSPFRILNFEDPEIVVIFIHLLKQSGIDLILQLRNTQVFNLNRVCDSPFTTYRDWWKSVDLFLELKQSTSVQGFSLEIDDKWFSVSYREENFQIMKLHFFRIVINVNVHLLTWLEAASLGFYVEDFLL